MTEIEYLKLKLEDKEKAFDKLHKLHMELLKKQGELENENNMLKERIRELEKENVKLRNDVFEKHIFEKHWENYTDHDGYWGNKSGYKIFSKY